MIALQDANILCLENKQIRVEVSTVGGHIERLHNKELQSEHIWNYNPKVWQRRTSLCFPICGRLPEDRYTYKGTEYTLFAHGFLRECTFSVAEKSETCVRLVLTQDAKTLEMYPFSFQLEIMYSLKESSLQIDYIVKNPSDVETLLYSIGSHYAYATALEADVSSDSYHLSSNSPLTGLRFQSEEGLLYQSSEEILLQQGTSVTKLINENSIVLHANKDEQTSITLSAQGKRAVTKISFSGFENLVLWAPYQGAPFFCMEPWAGMTGRVGDVASLSTKEGIQQLLPKSEKQFSMCISTVDI